MGALLFESMSIQFHFNLRNPFPQQISRIFRKIWFIFAISGKHREIVNYHCSPLCHYLFCEIYIVERSKEYQINDEHNLCPTCQRGIC